MKDKLKESFEWIDLENPPKDRLLKVIAKTTETTVHPEDPKYPKRLFAEANLIENANMIGLPVGVNHQKLPLYGSYVVDSAYNEAEKQLEALLFVPAEYVKKVAEGKIDHCSVEYAWRSDKKTKEGTKFEGLNITRIDLVEGLDAGDPKAKAVLFEAKTRTGRMLMEFVKPEKLVEGCVWSTQWDSPEACIAANKDKEDPEAYCMGKVGESKEQAHDCGEDKVWSEEEQKCILKPKAKETGDDASAVAGDTSLIKPAPEACIDGAECKKCGYHWYDNMCHAEPKKVDVEPPANEIEDLKEALRKVLAENKKLKDNFDEREKKAVDEAREKVLKLVEAKIPNAMVESRFNLGARRMCWEIKRVIRTIREEE